MSQELIERLKEESQDNPDDYRYQAADVIQSLQEQIALFEGTIESRDRNIQTLQAENEWLKQDRDEWRESTVMASANAASEEKRRRDMQEQRDALSAKLAELTKSVALKPLIPCVCTGDGIARMYCKDKSRCTQIVAYGIQAKGGQHEDS
jgi:chromosome segregation ATPase